MEAGIPVFPKFDTTGSNLSVEWARWIAKLENLFVAMNITAPKRQKALMLHLAGDDVMELFSTLTVAVPGDNDTVFTKARDALTGHFQPAENVEYQVYIFRQAKQEKGEKINQFYSRLKSIAASCKFTDINKEIKTQIIHGCSAHKLRLKALSTPDWDLDKLLSNGRAMELSESHAATIERNDLTESINKLSHQKTFRRSKSSQKPQRSSYQRPKSSKTCHNCGNQWPHHGGQRNCPAFGKSCTKCQKLHHFSKMCKSESREKVHQIEIESSESEHDVAFNVSRDKPISKLPMTFVRVNEIDASFLIDTGASVNIADGKLFKQLGQPKLSKASSIYGYGSQTKLPTRGKFTASIEKGSKFITAEFIVTDSGRSLLGYETSVELGLVNVINKVDKSSAEAICGKYPSVFKGIGKVNDVKVKLEVDETVKPIACGHRRQPYHLRKKIESKIKSMEKQDLIEEVSGPTPWIVPMVVVPKSDDDIRICLDMRGPNTAIQRTRQNTPSLDDLVHDLNGTSVFSKLDMNQAYHQ